MTDLSVLDQVVKAYDVRGTVPDQMNPDVCRALGTGFAVFVREIEPSGGAVIIGRDMRPSGPRLVEAFADGVMDQGLDVVDIGLASTDLLYFASGSLDLPGVMFTASHNPAGYNGMKLCRRGATPIGQESGLADIKRVAVEGAPPVPAVDRGRRTERDLLASFADHVRSFIDMSALRPLKVVADTANGMGGLVVPEIFAKLPFELEIMYPELDGTFPNHEANPLEAKNLVDLQTRVLETGADIGLAFDGDADRVFLVDEQAQPVSGSATTALLARAVLAANPGAKIIHNLICSKAVPEVIAESGGKAVRSRVGHSFIKQLMAESGAVFGGEHSAHYYFRDNWRADSGVIASVMVLEQLSRHDGPLSDLLAPLQRYESSGELNTRVADASAVIDHVADHYRQARCDRLDGLTVDFGHWWFNLRPSNTEPLLRLNLEAASSAEVDRRVAEVRAVMADAE